MATIAQLIERTEFLIDDEMDTELMITFFNEALEDLSNVAALEATVEYHTHEFVLPEDVVEIVAVYVIDHRERKARRITDKELESHRFSSYAYRVFGRNVEVFPKNEGVTIRVEYFKEIPKLPTASQDTSLQASPELPERYHKALSTYCAMQYAENDDNIYKLNNLRAVYQQTKDDMEKDYQKKKYRVRNNKVDVQVGWY